MVNEILEKYRQLRVVCAAWTEGDKTNEKGFIEKVREVITDFNDLLDEHYKKEEEKDDEDEEEDEE